MIDKLVIEHSLGEIKVGEESASDGGHCMKLV